MDNGVMSPMLGYFLINLATASWLEKIAKL